jgi:hypothetical protein
MINGILFRATVLNPFLERSSACYASHFLLGTGVGVFVFHYRLEPTGYCASPSLFGEARRGTMH